jgi:hypothetical protein
MSKPTSTNKPVSFDVIGKLAFGKQLGFLEHGSDFNGLIKTQSAFIKYVDIVSKSLPYFIGPPYQRPRHPKCTF